MKSNRPNVSGLVRPAPKAQVPHAASKTDGARIPFPLPRAWAPAWFYSALNWLAASYFDANHVEQVFQTYLAGSDVDPYAALGATRLFLVFRSRDGFRLTLAETLEGNAVATGGTTYASTDEGIREMYLAIANSPVFSRVKYAYVPSRIGSDLDPDLGGGLGDGYDPATGLRSCVLASAVAQIVPLDDFLKTSNEQVYDPTPAIVPLVSALVYDLTDHNTLGDRTFTLPTYYARDRVGATDYVNRGGQTVSFAGGPGYADATATALVLTSTTSVTVQGQTFTTSVFDRATVVAIAPTPPSVMTGVATLTCSAASLASAFANQRVLGFYRDNAWSQSLGLPIWDYGTANTSFTSTTATPLAPTTIYDPTHAFLNGGTLQNVVRRLREATYVYSWDRLVALLDTATTGSSDRGVGLAVTTAALDIAPSGSIDRSIGDRLEVPIVATVTTTPVQPQAVKRAAAARVTNQPVLIGGGANAPKPITAGPVSVELGLTASIPREALDGTGITSLEIGTPFAVQALGAGAAFAGSSGIALNLMERPGDPALPPYDLSLADAKLAAGVSYVFALAGATVTVRGSDGTTATMAVPQAPAGGHTYVGMLLYTSSATTVRLYPLVELALPAPAVGTNGILQGETYSIRLTYGKKTSTYDVTDAAHAAVATQVGVTSPKPTDSSAPRAGDLYFGGFIGGAATVSVWSVPVFAIVTPSDLAGVSFDGTMTLGAQVSGVPAYHLPVTDSSVFIFTNLDVDNGTLGGPSSANVFLANVVLNTAPDDHSASAFAPCGVVMGLVRQVRMGTGSRLVFIPADDSVLIGSVRYMLSVIELAAVEFDPNARPYPPLAWPQSRYWQFANKHDPYLDVGYVGEAQADRVSRAQRDATRIGEDVAGRREPIQLYLDTDRDLLRIWPIYAFPFDRVTQQIDPARLAAIEATVLQLIAATPPVTAQLTGSAEKVAIPDVLMLANPYTAGLAPTTSGAPHANVVADLIAPSVIGRPVTNLDPGAVAPPIVDNLASVQSQRNHALQRDAAAASFVKSQTAGLEVVQTHFADETAIAKTAETKRERQRIYGFSLYNPGTGEAYLVELVDADQDIPDQLPRPTEHTTYDPFYVRVVFLARRICYQMSIIVPAMVHDQYGHFAYEDTTYGNLLAKTDELGLGYLYSLFDGSDAFDELTFDSGLYAEMVAFARRPVFTNLPYHLAAPVAAELAYVAPPYFACRRKNWSADCHLMRATHVARTAAYLAFGAGDLVPMRLDAAFRVDKRAPAHLYKLTYTFADRQYNSAKTISVSNRPYVVAVTTDAAGVPHYANFSIAATAGTTDLEITQNQTLAFPTEIYVVGQTSTTLISVADINASLGTTLANTGDFINLDPLGIPAGQEFQLIPFNNLVYLVRAVANCPALSAVGGLGVVSGLLIDTYVPATTGNLALAQGARHKRSGLPYFGASYTPTTMVDTLDNLDFTSITGETFFAPTIFIPIPELDATRGFVADISAFLGQQFWTLIYPEIIAQRGTVVNSVEWDHDVNLDAEGKPVLSLQKLHFVYDPLVVLFTPNDLSHKYQLLPKQQVLALTNGQIQEGICWRSAHLQDQRLPPTNVCAQQLLPAGPGMDRPNIIYAGRNRPVSTPAATSYLGMSVHGFVSVSGTVYSIEESALATDQTGTSFVSAVSSNANMAIGVLFDYDNNDLGTLDPYDPSGSTKGIAFLNGYLGATGYSFSSPDHFDVNDVLPSQVPLLEQIANTLGFEAAFFDTDVSLPRQFWSLTYDGFTAPTVPNFITNVPPGLVDPSFSNRTRSLVLSLQNPLHPDQLGMMDTFSSIVSANLHLENGVTGSVFLSKKADRDVASIGSNPTGANCTPLYGLPTKYDFFIFSRDHYTTLKGASFELIDHGYAMCLLDDGTGTGTKVAKYFVDSAGNYNELVTYALYSPNGGLLESSTFPLKVMLGTPANLAANPIIPATPNSINPQDLVTQINKVSTLIYAAFGPSSPGQPPAFLPIQTSGGAVQAVPPIGAPALDGYLLGVVGANRQPVRISQIYSGTTAFAISGTTTVVPYDQRKSKSVPFYGSIAHGLDRMVPTPSLSRTDGSVIPRPTVPADPSTGLFGGNGLGALIASPFSWAFQGSGAVPPAIAANPTPGTTMKADDTVFYTYNAITNAVMDSTGKSTTLTSGQYFVDATDPSNPIYAVVSLPTFILDNTTYTVNLATTLADGVTSRYSLVVGGKSYLFGPDNAHVTVDRTVFTFAPLTGGVYTVTYSSLDQPATAQAPSPITLLTTFSIAAGGVVTQVDVFNDPGALAAVVTGVVGRHYAYDPVHGTVTITAGTTTTTVPLVTATIYTSISGYGYAIGFANGSYTVNDSPMFPYAATTTGTPATHALMTAPKMFTLGGNFFTFDQDAAGNYVSVTGNHATYPINPYQFSINGVVYIINTNVQPNTVIGGGNVCTMTGSNTQFVLNGVQYTIALKQGSLDGATLSGQFNITQADVVVIENYVYELDTPNGRVVGNGVTYPLTTSGVTYTITTADRSFTVTTEPNAATVTIRDVVYQINNTTVVGDGVTYPILVYRTFDDNGSTFRVGADGVVAVTSTLPLTGQTFTDGATYTVAASAAFDGTTYVPLTGAPAQFSAAGRTYTLRNDGVAIAAGPAKTYLLPTSTNQISFGPQTIFWGRTQDLAAFDGAHYFAIANNQFTDTVRGATYTLDGNTAVHDGNSYEVFSNLGQGAYFQIPGGTVYYVNIPVADTGSANGDIFHVFPIASNQFTVPLAYTITLSASSAAISGPTGPIVSHLTVAGSVLTGGTFTDPVTGITYAAVSDAGSVKFVDSNNATIAFPAAGTTDQLIAIAVVSTAVPLAVDDQATPQIYPVTNNRFTTGSATYTVNVPIAYSNAAGPYFPMTNGRFVVPQAAPRSTLAYTVGTTSVTKGYVVSVDDQFSADGAVVYTVNAVNVVKATNQVTLTGTTLTAGARSYTLDDTTQAASLVLPGINFSTATKQFAVSYNGTVVTYTVGATTATDGRTPLGSFALSTSGSVTSFTDTVSGVTFQFDPSGNNPITARFRYVEHFFTDPFVGVTYYVDTAATSAEAISYLSELTRYAFTPADGHTYLLHYNDVQVSFPVIAGPNVNAGIASVGANTFVVDIDRVEAIDGSPAIPLDRNSFEINGNLYTITGTPVGTNYSACSVAGHGSPPRPFLTANTFQLGDPSITYTLQLDASNLPHRITASFPVQPSRDLISIDDDVYVISFNTTTTGTLLGQGNAAIAITNSGFTLTNPFDTTKPKFVFADLDIYDAASVVGQFSVYLAPTFFLGGATYTLDTVKQVVRDGDKRPFPLLPNPTLFSVNGANFVIDSNQIPHAIVGNNNVSPLATDVTVLSGVPIPNTTFTLGGLIYKYTEDSTGNLLAVTGTKSYPIAQPAGTFKLDTSLVFTLVKTAPAADNYPGTTVPIGTITAGPTTLNVYAGSPESGGADFFTYKNVLYTLVASSGTYVAVQKTYSVYAAQPVPGQQQLAVFDLDGTTYLVTDGTTTGAGPAAGINPGTMWAATAISNVETQFGLVYGFAAQPTPVTRSATGLFQFSAVDSTGTTTLYDVTYTTGGNANVVQIDVPALLPSFWQTALFAFTQSYALTFETGGYNAFTTFVKETSLPSESFAAAYRTPVTSSDPLIDTLVTAQGDLSVELWHSIPTTTPSAYHPFTYAASTMAPLVYFLDIDFEDDTNIFIGINNTVLLGVGAPPVFSSGWRHVALTYQQPYTMLCEGAGFEVKQGDQYNFNRDFSIALTFNASDVSTVQGLLYKGTGSDVTAPQLNMSYRVGISDQRVTLQFTDAGGAFSPLFLGPQVLATDQFFQVIVVKHTTTPAGRDDTPDPYAAPFDTTDLGPLASGGMSGNASGFPSGGGSITISDLAPAGAGANTRSVQFLDSIANPAAKGYSVSISVRTVGNDGTFGGWQTATTNQTVTNGDTGLAVATTGGAHLLIGAAFDDTGGAMPLGSSDGEVGNIRQVYLFNSALDPTGIRTSSGATVDLANATSDDLSKAGLVGYWMATYDPDGVVTNPFDAKAVAISTNGSLAFLAPLSGHEREGATLYVNGFAMTLSLVTGSAIPASMTGYSGGASQLVFDAGLYRLAEIAMWRMVRQPYQVLDDMFGRLIPTNEPSLAIYLSGSFVVQDTSAPILPMNKYVDNIAVANAVSTLDLAFSPASLDLAGCPAVGRCGPLITPNLYTPPGVALTVCDSVPSLTTYSVTLNSVTGTLAGEINEVYVYIKSNVLTLYAGKKIGDLVLSWVSQEQGDVQLIGYIEGAPPAPMANLTNKASYAGATSLTMSAPTSLTLKLQHNHDDSTEQKIDISDAFGVRFGLGTVVAPFGAGFKTEGDGTILGLTLSLGVSGSYMWTDGSGQQQTASNKLDESNKYTVKLQGSPAPVTGDLFMANLNSGTTPSTTAGVAASKSAILPNPNLGGFTTSNAPAPIPKAPTEEKFGARMYVPSPYGQAFVTSQTVDVYQQTLLQTNTVYGFVRIPNTQIPRDLNIVSFRMNSQYLRPGILDGVIGYAYNPATLATGAQTYTTSTGEMQVVYDKNFSPGTVGHDASYMRIVEAYKLKRQIDQQAFNALALYQTQFKTDGRPDDSRLTPGLDFYNEYVWTARGGTQEVKHTYTTSYDEVYNTTTGNTAVGNVNFNLKLAAGTITVVDIKLGYTYTDKWSAKSSYNTTGTSSFDLTASFDGIESDTQMRYASNNDAHFVMKLNSMFNPNNQSGLNLVVGSDALVYNVAPSVASGAGLPESNNLDDSLTYTQPPPAYASGNANGITGALEPYDRPGKIKQFRTLAFFLQPSQDNNDNFWNSVVDPLWLANSDEADARAMRTAQQHNSVPWRVLYRVTYCERFLPPVSTDPIVVPQILPVMAVPVLEAAADFMFQSLDAPGPRPAHNPLNDLTANIVLAAPTASGASAGALATSGPSIGLPILPNNAIPFDVVKSASSIVNWGDATNSKLMTQLLTSVLGLNTVPMATRSVPGSTKLYDVVDPVTSELVYSVFTDPNGFNVNIAVKPGITVYQDVNANPIQYYDGKAFHSLQADYIATNDGTIMYYIQPPSTYDQSTFDLTGDYDLFGHPGDQWRYFLVSGMSANMTDEPTVVGLGPFLASGGFAGFRIAKAQHASTGKQVQGYVLVQGILQWPHLNSNAEALADVLVYKAMSLLDTFPIGDPEVMIAFLKAQYAGAPFNDNDEICLVFARNITSYFNAIQQALLPQ